MTTLIGIDAATKANNIGLARGHIVNNRVLVEEVSLGTEVESISKTVAGWISGPTVIAIDAPLGWPHADVCAIILPRPWAILVNEVDPSPILHPVSILATAGMLKVFACPYSGIW